MQPCRIKIHLASQRLDLWRGSVPGEKVVFSTPISSSSRGIGTTPGSLKTPTGRFAIAEKIGADAPIGMVFRGRLPTGQLINPVSSEDEISSRILWLDGLEEANRNTKSRYIYLHGTNDEARLGLPGSHGCIRLGNQAIIDLFEQVAVGTPVEIFA